MPPSTLPVEYPPGRLRQAGLLLVAVVFAGVGAYVLTTGEGLEIVGGVAAIGVFGMVGIPALVWQARKRPVMVRLTEDGVELHQRPFVPWSEIEDVEIRTVAGARMIVFLLHDGAVERLTANRPTGASAVRNDTRVIGRDAVATSPSVRGGPHQLVDEIREHLEHVRSEQAPPE